MNTCAVSATTSLLGSGRRLTLTCPAAFCPQMTYIGIRGPVHSPSKWQGLLPRSYREDRDHAPPSFGDPHKTPPPKGSPSASATHSSAASSDLEFGSDAFSGGTLETPAQLEQQHPERLHQQEIAREAYEAHDAAQGIARLVLEELREEQQRRREQQQKEAHKALATDESTAEEREERYQGILQAMDSLGATRSTAGGASDDEGEQLSPDAARLAGSGEDLDAERRFDVLRHTVDMLGEGDEVAELIKQSYQGRNLEAEALGTMDPADMDHMPHPGDRYLPPHAVRPRKLLGGAVAARLNRTHDRPGFERRVLKSPPTRGVSGGEGWQAAPAAAAWMPPGEGSLSAAARVQHEPVGKEQEEQRQASEGVAGDMIELGGCSSSPGRSSLDAGDDPIDYEQDAMWGADALYYAPDHTANPAVNDVDTFDIEGGAQRGNDSMFYFKTGGSDGPGEPQALQGGAVWGVLHDRDEKHNGGFPAAIDTAATAKAGPGVKHGGRGKHPAPPRNTAAAAPWQEQEQEQGQGSGKQKVPRSEAVLSSLRRRQVERQLAAKSLQSLAERLKGGRGPPPPEPKAGLARLLEVVVGRAAVAGLGAAFFSELVTQQSMMSQLLGRWEGPRQIEYALPACQVLAAAALIGAVAVTLLERIGGGGDSPRWCPLRLSPLAQLWLGRAAMGLFALLLAYETVHSNRPAFGTLFYLWF